MENKGWEPQGELTMRTGKCPDCNKEWMFITSVEDTVTDIICSDCQELIDKMNNRNDKIKDILK